MKKSFLIVLSFSALLFFYYCSDNKSPIYEYPDPHPDQDEEVIQKKLELKNGLIMHGKAIQFDPAFPYYKNRTAESIADEISLTGCNSVHYTVVNENDINADIISAFHERGIAVWLLVFGNGTYSTQNFPSNWRDWQMELVKPSSIDSYTFFSLFNKDYINWKKENLARIVSTYKFDGIGIIESFFPEWNGLNSGVYGDVGPNAIKAFKKEYNLDIPDFYNPSSANYYTKNTDTYNKWIQFRVDAVNNFLNEIFNGKGGVREARPEIIVATWSLGVDAPDAISRLREYQGIDANKMISAVKPDVHFLQTHWVDWMKSEDELQPDYIKKYHSFYNQARKSSSNIPIGVQADFGSLESVFKSPNWQKEYDLATKKHGYTLWTGYEYHVGGDMYTKKPQAQKVERINKSTITISFNKRINETTAKNTANYKFFANGNEFAVTTPNISVDGNMIIIKANNFPTIKFEIILSNIEDTPDLWFFKNYPANKIAPNSAIKIPKSSD